MDTWTLELPFQRPLSLNDRMHHMVRYRKAKPYREAACWLAKAAKIPPCERIKVVLVYTPPDRRRRDPINLTATQKVAEDGLVDAGVVPDDTPRYVQSLMPIIDLPNKDKPTLKLVIERIA